MTLEKHGQGKREAERPGNLARKLGHSTGIHPSNFLIRAGSGRGKIKQKVEFSTFDLPYFRCRGTQNGGV